MGRGNPTGTKPDALTFSPRLHPISTQLKHLILIDFPALSPSRGPEPVGARLDEGGAGDGGVTAATFSLHLLRHRSTGRHAEETVNHRTVTAGPNKSRPGE